MDTDYQRCDNITEKKNYFFNGGVPRNSSSRQVMHPRLIDYSEEDESDRHFFSAGKSRIVARKRYQFFQTTELKQVAWEKLIRWKATSPLFQ